MENFNFGSSNVTRGAAELYGAQRSKKSKVNPSPQGELYEVKRRTI